MLLLWLSIVSMIPFDMERLDSNTADAKGTRNVVLYYFIKITHIFWLTLNYVYWHVKRQTC